MDPQKLRNPDEVRFFCGRSNPQLAEKICSLNHIPLEKAEFKRFSNDDLHVQLDASVRKRGVYIVQSLCPPVDQNLMELLLMLDIARSSGAKEVHAIIPYYSYARSDKKDAARISITGRLVADLLQTAGANHVMTMMLHSPQVHGFFRVQPTRLPAGPFLPNTSRAAGADPHHRGDAQHRRGQIGGALRPGPGRTTGASLGGRAASGGRARVDQLAAHPGTAVDRDERTTTTRSRCRARLTSRRGAAERSLVQRAQDLHGQLPLHPQRQPAGGAGPDPDLLGVQGRLMAVTSKTPDVAAAPAATRRRRSVPAALPGVAARAVAAVLRGLLPGADGHPGGVLAGDPAGLRRP